MALSGCCLTKSAYLYSGPCSVHTFAAWDDNEVETTRKRILMTIYPEWEIKREMGIADSKLGRNVNSGKGQCTENVIMRLVFHDCIPYTDGTGGCDGCMNWHGMDSETPSPNDESHMYKFEPVNSTDNKVHILVSFVQRWQKRNVNVVKQQLPGLACCC